jgi:hypothetical protein
LSIDTIINGRILHLSKLCRLLNTRNSFSSLLLLHSERYQIKTVDLDQDIYSARYDCLRFEAGFECCGLFFDGGADLLGIVEILCLLLHRCDVDGN